MYDNALFEFFVIDHVSNLIFEDFMHDCQTKIFFFIFRKQYRKSELSEKDRQERS